MRIFDIKGFSVLKQSQKLNRGVGGVRVRVNMYYHAPDQNKPFTKGPKSRTPQNNPNIPPTRLTTTIKSQWRTPHVTSKKRNHRQTT